MKKANLLTILLMLPLLPMGVQAANTGFNQTGAGPWDYNTAANWVGGNINGIWDTSLTLGAAQTVTFGANTVLSTGLTFNYAGNYALTLDSTNSTVETVTLGGNLAMNPSGGSSANVTLGDPVNQLNLNLGGGTCTMTVAANTLSILNAISNGGITKAGSGTLTLSGANTYGGVTTVSAGTLNFSSLGPVGGGSSALGAPTTAANGTINVGGSASLYYTGGAAVSDRVINLTGATTLKDNSGSLNFSGGITGSGTLNFNHSATITETGPIALGGNSLTQTGSGTVNLNNAANTFGTVIIYQGTLSVNSIANSGVSSALGSGGTIEFGQATTQGKLQFTGPSGGSCNRTLDVLAGTTSTGGGILENTVAGQTLTMSGNLECTGGTAPSFQLIGAGNGVMSGTISNPSGSLSIAKSGTGTWTLSGANTYSGVTTVNGGTLILNYANNATIIPSANTVTLGGGALSLQGQNTSTSAQTLGNVTLNAGGSGISVTGGSSGTMNLTLGNTWTRAAGSAVNITLGTGGTLTSSPGTANTLVVGSGGIAFATVNGTDWAKVSSGTVVGFASGDYSTGLPASGASSTVNYSQTDSGSVTASETVNTLKLNTSQASQSLAIASGQTLTLGAGGLMFVGGNAYSVTGGSLEGTSGAELVVHQYGSGNLTISSAIPNNGTATALTKAGTGTLTLTTTENYSGVTTVGGGALLVNGTLNGSTALTVFPGATLGGSGTVKGTLTVNAGGILAPTLSGTPGTLTFSSSGTPTFNAPCTLNIRIPTSSTADKVALTSGTPTFPCGNLNLFIDTTGLSGDVTTPLTIVSTANASGVTGTFASVTANNGYTPSVTYNANSITVTLAGTITTSEILSALSTYYGTASAPTTFAVSGAQLTGNLTVTPPAGYEISTSSGTGYATSLTLTPTSGTLAATTLYLRLAASTGIGTYAGNTTISGGGAASVNVPTASSAVNPLPVQLTGARGYDGMTDAAYPILAITNIVGSDSVNLASGTGTLAGATVGSQAIISFGTLTLGGAQAGNYTLTGAGGSVSINPASLGITASNLSKTYGQTVTFSGTEFSANGLLGSDSVTSVSLASLGATNTAAAGGYTIVASSARGSGLTNYNINYVSGTLTVNPLAAALAGTRAYDGTTHVAGAILAVTNAVNGDVVTLSGTGGLASPYVGTEAITSIGSLALSGGVGTNYTLVGASGTVIITNAYPSTNLLVSSANPSGFLTGSTFTNILPVDATGSVVFASTNGPISTNTVSGGLATSLSATNLPRGTNVITATYSGDTNYLGASVSLNQVVTNHPPLANVMIVTRTAGLALLIPLSEIATNWSDADGDAVELTGVSTQSTNGINLIALNWSTNVDGSIVTTNAWAFIGYTNGPNVADQITYSISDGQGGTNIGYVEIVINDSVTGTNSITAFSFGTGSNTVTAYGIPFYYYILERATNLGSPVWVDLQTNQAATNGLINATDTFWDLGGIPPSPSAFYQLKWQP